MKKTLFFFAAALMSATIWATNAQLVVEQVNNNGAVSGNTYRVYAQMPDAQHSLHIVYGDMENPLMIETTAPFYQNSFGGYSAVNLSQAAMEINPALKYDSYITLGYDNSADNSMWDIGVDFDEFNAGNGIMTNDGGWFLLPTDAKCTAGSNNLILIAQFTTTGVVTGTLNLQGWLGPQEVWREKGLTFTTTNAQVFGCTDATASNYSANATYNDGTCTYNSTTNTTQQTGHNGVVSKTENTNSWEIFPNPLRDNLIHLQFKNTIDVVKASTKVEIVDMTGKLIVSKMISQDAVVGGNRITLTQDLASGTYKVVLTQGGKQESQTLIVEK